MGNASRSRPVENSRGARPACQEERGDVPLPVGLYRNDGIEK